MLKRLYVDNYRCMVNFEFVPQATQLILGANGSGKSSMFDVLLLLRRFIAGQDRLEHLVDISTLTAWENRKQQTFEIDVQGQDCLYSYKLILDYEVETNQCRVLSETLGIEGKRLLEFVDGEVAIYRKGKQDGYSFSFPRNQSAFATLSERKDHNILRWFRNWLAGVHVIRINPFGMHAQSTEEIAWLDQSAANFASWYRYLVQESPDLIDQIKQSLCDVWTGFKGLRLESAGMNTKVLKVALNVEPNGIGTKYELALSQVSDGQRTLVVLYTLLHYLKHSTSLVGFDEPDNFVALPEIQPWIMALSETVEDNTSQALVISHHPELINYLASQNAVVFSRSDGGHTRVKPFQTMPGTTLSPAEVISRGWDGE